MVDGSENLSEEDEEICKLLKGKKLITVVNKTDKQRVLPKQENEIEVSAMTNKNIEQLKQKVVDMVIEEEIDFNSLVLTNERQMQILREAKMLIEEVKQKQNESLDILAMFVKRIWQTLGKITGNTENEDIIDLIFSKFCLGK